MTKIPPVNLFLGLAGVALAASGGLAYWQYRGFTDLRAETQQLSKRVEDEKSVRRRLASSSEQVERTRDLLAHLESGLPEQAYLPTLLKDLETVGGAHGIKVSGVRPTAKRAVPKRTGDKAPPEARKPYSELDLEVKGSGTFDAIMTFVRALKEFPKIAEVRALSLQPIARQPSGMSPTLEMTAMIRAYVMKPDKSVAAEKEPATEGAETHG